MNNSELIRYISAYIRNWMDDRGLTQTQAGERLSINRGQLNGILNNNRGLSVEKLEKISYATGKSGLDALIEGRELLEENGKKRNDTDELTPKQRNAIEAFILCIKNGGEGAEILADQAIRLAQKKQAETEYQHSTSATISKSA